MLLKVLSLASPSWTVQLTGIYLLVERQSDDSELEDDVLVEKKRVLSPSNQDQLKVKKISKVFKQRGLNDKLLAVDDLTFSIPKYQVLL